ncbi:UNVERIFIED_CONTAM: hypothetical protein Sradi_0723600 [Sesamum radiatum]|uniref:Uncharacterized protein n=1 Tax=Sesamum radiatum TaxID=300843 RepID=A0AAW2VT04_SESRA
MRIWGLPRPRRGRGCDRGYDYGPPVPLAAVDAEALTRPPPLPEPISVPQTSLVDLATTGTSTVGPACGKLPPIVELTTTTSATTIEISTAQTMLWCETIFPSLGMYTENSTRALVVLVRQSQDKSYWWDCNEDAMFKVFRIFSKRFLRK